MLEKNIVENVALPNLLSWRKHKLVDKSIEKEITKKYISKLMIKVSSLKTPTKYISGGNQQKVVLSKWLAGNCSILLMDEPTRGIDVNAKNEIYGLMLDFVKNGGSIVMVSSELPEILGISDRIMIMREGRCVGFMNREDATEKSILSSASIN